MALVCSRLLHLRSDYTVYYQFLALQLINNFIPYCEALSLIQTSQDANTGSYV